MLEVRIFTHGLTTGDPRFADYNAKFLQAHAPGARFRLPGPDAAMALEHAVGEGFLYKTGKITPTTLKSAETLNVAVFTGKMPPTTTRAACPCWS